ncbi:MAG: DUF4352 domain-containing protein [Bryobacteraceae bacterium]|nr:DUF4352 domain-containing protein [Bryobacteraceae bacterium]
MLAACNSPDKAPPQAEFQMGERFSLGPLTYNVQESAWRSQLGDAGRSRHPEQRFLLVTVSIQNNSNSEVTIPPFVVRTAAGQEFTELSNGEGVDHWLGLIRTIKPKQFMDGVILFDVALASYKLKLTHSSDTEQERVAFVPIPARIDIEQPIAPIPGAPPQP